MSGGSRQTISPTEIGFNEVSGVALGIAGNENTVQVTDFGAIEAASNLAIGAGQVVQSAIGDNRKVVESALREGTQQFKEAGRVVNNAVDAISIANRDALNFGAKSMGTVERNSAKSMAVFEGVNSSSLGFGRTALGMVERSGTNAVDSVKSLAGSFGASVERLAKSTAANNDERMAQVSKWLIVGVVGFGAASLIANKMGKKK